MVVVEGMAFAIVAGGATVVVGLVIFYFFLFGDEGNAESEKDAEKSIRVQGSWQKSGQG